MEKELALFPLNLVAFPGENLNLHIFEPRYKQLINDCLREKTTFGIPSYVLTKIEYGTEVKIVEVQKTYDDGRMDIRTEGIRVFKVKDYQNPWAPKEYAGGVVELVQLKEKLDPKLNLKIVELANVLFEWLHAHEEVSLRSETALYDIIHKIGLKPDEEYRILKMDSEVERQKYVIDHLQKLIPALERAEKAREKIKMNGHFKHLDPLKF